MIPPGVSLEKLYTYIKRRSRDGEGMDRIRTYLGIRKACLGISNVWIGMRKVRIRMMKFCLGMRKVWILMRKV